MSLRPAMLPSLALFAENKSVMPNALSSSVIVVDFFTVNLGSETCTDLDVSPKESGFHENLLST